MKSALASIGWVLAGSIAVYFLWVAFHALRLQDLYALASLPVLAAIALASILYSLIIPISGAAWAVLLDRHGETWTVGKLTTIMAVTQLGKYIPGGIVQPIGRGALSSRFGMQLRPLAVSMVEESILAVAASVGVGIAMLWMASPSGLAGISALHKGIALFGPLAAIAAIAVVAYGNLLVPQKVRDWGMLAKFFHAVGPGLGPRATLMAFSAYCVNYLVIGVGVFAIGRALDFPQTASYALLTGTFSLAWLIGFVVASAPAGLGVREGAMSFLLADKIPAAQIVEWVIAVRLATLIGDGICFGAGFVSLQRWKQGGANGH